MSTLQHAIDAYDRQRNTGLDPRGTHDFIVAVVGDLGARLGVDLGVVRESVDDTEGDIVGLARSSPPPTGELAKQVVVLVCANFDSGIRAVTALVFVYVGGTRVGPPGRDFLVFSADEASSRPRVWKLEGWKADEHGEYGAYERF